MSTIENSLDELFNGKYKEILLKSKKTENNSFTIDFNDLSEEAKKLLNSKYMEYEESGLLDEIISFWFNKIETIDLEPKEALKKELERTKIYKKGDIKLHFINVTPKKRLREISSELIGGLIELNGVIIGSYPPQSIIAEAFYSCPKCGNEITVSQYSNEIIEPDECNCGNKRGFILSLTKSKWDDYQEYILQENPEEIEMGVVPRSIHVIAKGKHLIDKCKAGDFVDITCSILPIESKRGRTRIYTQSLFLNNVEILNKDSFSVEIDDDDILYLTSLAETTDIEKLLSFSIFPSIYGWDDVKLGMILAAFGGVDKKQNNIWKRGAIHVLLIGDPSVAKTKILEAISVTLPKAIYTSGTSTTGVGLTAAAIQDEKGWRLEAGALVLADGGLCCIDEIEKMSKEETLMILEAMSKQTVTVNKSSIHTTLRARTTVIGAANPTSGRYDENEYLTDNISLSPVLLSRFDLIFIMKDIPDEKKDREMADVIFRKEEQIPVEQMLNVETIKKYILYAKKLNPVLSSSAKQKILDFYIPLRQQSMRIENTPIAIAPRQLEGLKRIAEARARMFLREEVTEEDAEVAIKLMLRSLSEAGYDPNTGKTDISIIETGKSYNTKQQRSIVLNILRNLVTPITADDILDLIVEYGFKMTREEVINILSVLRNEGYLMNPNRNTWLLVESEKTYKHMMSSNYGDVD